MNLKQSEKDTINLYAELKKEIKLLEKKEEQYKTEVLFILQNNKLEEITLPTGKLTLGSRRTWKYTPEVVEKEKELKEMKKTEEQLGKADYVENFYPIFKEAKEE